MTKQEAQVQVAVLKRLLRGEPVDSASLSAATGFTSAAVGAALVTLHSAGALYLADGNVVAAYPLSAVPTPHRLRIGRSVTYANCALDALAVPCMADGRVDIDSECAQCGKPITIQMIGEHVLTVQPETPVLFSPTHVGDKSGPAVLILCPSINFFCTAEHADRWRTSHPEQQGTVLTLAQGVARARALFDRVISSVGGAR
jgi:hypothetical protein